MRTTLFLAALLAATAPSFGQGPKPLKTLTFEWTTTAAYPVFQNIGIPGLTTPSDTTVKRLLASGIVVDYTLAANMKNDFTEVVGGTLPAGTKGKPCQVPIDFPVVQLYKVLGGMTPTLDPTNVYLNAEERFAAQDAKITALEAAVAQKADKSEVAALRRQVQCNTNAIRAMLAPVSPTPQAYPAPAPPLAP